MLFWTPWLPLSPERIETLSDVPGLYEVKVERRLVEYPVGRSAMVYYGKTDDGNPSLRRLVLRDWFGADKEAIRTLWEAHGPLVFRWAATDAPDREHDRRLRLFTERFGRPPWGNPTESS